MDSMDPTMIAERREVWIALSDLFLDTDVRLNFAYIARVLAASRYTLEELEAICRDEVAPAVESNLLDIAGDWAGFPEEWLIGQITARPPGHYRIKTNALNDFRAVAHLASALRALPPEKREERVQLWHKLQPLFLDRNPTRPASQGLNSSNTSTAKRCCQPTAPRWTRTASTTRKPTRRAAS